MNYNYIQRLGSIAIATRLKNLSEKLLNDGLLIYRESETDFEPRWFVILNLLFDRGSMSITEIAAQLNQSHPAVNQVSGMLEEKGLIESQKDESDSRKRKISLTEAGVQKIRELEPLWQAFREAIDELLNDVPENFLHQITTIEQKLAERSMYGRINSKMFEAGDPGYPVTVSYRPEYQKYFYALNKAWLEEHFVLEASDKLVLEQPEEQIINKGGAILFLEVEDTVVGTLALIKHNDKTCELAKMAVHQNHRAQGFGRKLLIDAFRTALKMGFDEMILFTSRKLIAANSLYYSFEFLDTKMTADEEKKYERLSFKMKLNINQKIDEV